MITDFFDGKHCSKCKTKYQASSGLPLQFERLLCVTVDGKKVNYIIYKCLRCKGLHIAAYSAEGIHE